jgi:hypothetical protein
MVFAVIMRGFKVGNEVVDSGLVLRISQGQMDAIGGEIPCTRSTNAANTSSVKWTAQGDIVILTRPRPL